MESRGYMLLDEDIYSRRKQGDLLLEQDDPNTIINTNSNYKLNTIEE